MYFQIKNSTSDILILFNTNNNTNNANNKLPVIFNELDLMGQQHATADIISCFSQSQKD